jgi:hypothetical protein
MCTPYYQKILNLFGSSIIAYWPLWEPSGSVAADMSGNGRNGVYTYAGVHLGYPGIGDGRTCPYFDGEWGYVNCYSAALAAAFNGVEGTILIWPKAYNAGIWSDGKYHYTCEFEVNEDNVTRILKNLTNELKWLYTAGGVMKVVSLTVTPTTWMHLGMTWSKSNDRMRAFYNGLQTGTDQTGLGTWVGAPNADETMLGNRLNTLTWYGYLAHGAVLNREATPTEMATAATL